MDVLDVSRKGLDHGRRLAGCDEKKKKKKKKKKRTPKEELPLDMVFEFLTRLPLKNLSQCRCVSKVWRSIIEHPSFVESYRSRQPLCLVSSIPIGIRTYRAPAAQRFYYSTFGSQQEPPVNLFNICWFDKERVLDIRSMVTRIVNGLFCYLCHNQLFLRNLFTGESIRFPLPDVPDNILPSFYFGFDHVNGVYKLLSLTPLKFYESQFTTTVNFQCDILTLGSNSTSSWRRLPNFTSSILFDADDVFVNETLYWKPDMRLLVSSDKIPVECFNLTDEKFSSFEIHLPEPCPSSTNYFVQFRGRFSMLSCVRERLILYTMADDDKSLGWTRHEAIFPSEIRFETISPGGLWRHYGFAVPDTSWPNMVPVGNLPTGELLLMNERFFEDPKIDNSITPIYSYDDRNNKFERFVVGKLPQRSWFLGREAFRVMEHNIGTLDAILGRGK